jgi:holin-like protein
MLIQLGVLMSFQLIGEAVVKLLGVPFPGSLLGMLLLLGYLFVRGGPSQELTKVGATLIDNLGLLFVPAGSAIVAYWSLLARDGFAIAMSILLSTVAAVLVCGVLAAKGVSLAAKRRRTERVS